MNARVLTTTSRNTGKTIKILISYATPVAYWYDDKVIVEDHVYSRTTSKHVGIFQREMCSDKIKVNSSQFRNDLRFHGVDDISVDQL